MSEHIYPAIGAVVGLLIVIGLFALPVMMAKKRGRSAAGWLLLSFFITPIYAIIALAVLGDSKEKICSEIIGGLEQSEKSKLNMMKNNDKFILGVLTGVFITISLILLLSFIFSSPESSEEETDALTLFEQPADIIETASFEVQEVLPDGNAIAKTQDKNIDYYSDPTVLFLADENSHYYDKQIIKVAKGKCAYQVGIYQHEQYFGTNSTLPVIRIMDK